MSNLWPELLRITLCPDQVVLERGKLIISLKGLEPRYLESETIPVEAKHEPSLWAAPLAVLGIALDGLPERTHNASVILSNHFVHYPLVQADCPNESGGTVGIVGDALKKAINQLLEQHNCRLTSLQPRIIAFGNIVSDELQGESGWLVLIEEGLACLGLIQDGEFVRLRNLYMWPASSVELLALLDQEAQQAGIERLPRTLFIWRRDESDEVALPLNAGWHIHRVGEQIKASVPRPSSLLVGQAMAGVRT